MRELSINILQPPVKGQSWPLASIAAVNNDKRAKQMLCASWRKKTLTHEVISPRIIEPNPIKPLAVLPIYRKYTEEKNVLSKI